MAGDVNPLEIMVHLPALCRSKNVPFAFVRSIARLGKLTNTKTATCVALTDVKKEDLQDFNTLQKTFMANFNDNVALNKLYGGGLMGIKNQHMMKKRQAILDLEAARKANI